MYSLSRSLLAFCRAATLLAAGTSLLLALASARGAESGTNGVEIVLPPEPGGIGPGHVLSAPVTAERLARRARHREDPSLLPGEGRYDDPATRVAWSRGSGPGLFEVALVTVHGGGHTIPQPGARCLALPGLHSEDLDVPAEAWIFFDGGTRPRRRP